MILFAILSHNCDFSDKNCDVIFKNTVRLNNFAKYVVIIYQCNNNNNNKYVLFYCY